MNPDFDKKIALVFILAISSLGVVAKFRPTYVSGVSQTDFLAAKVQPESAYDLVVAGDSRVMRGIAPGELELATDLRALNFGFRSAPLNRRFLESALKAIDADLTGQNSEKVIVLGVTANAFTRSSVRDNDFESAVVAVETGKRQIPSWYAQLQRRLSPISLTELKNIVLGTTQTGTFETYHADGWVETKMNPPNQRQALPFYRIRFQGNKADAQVIDESLDFISTAVDAGVRVFGFAPPVTSQMAQIEADESGFDLGTYIQQFQSCGGIWLDPGTNDVETYDGSHLSAEAARLFSRRLGESIRAYIIEANRTRSPTSRPN